MMILSQAAFALGKARGVPDDSIQYALEWEPRNYAKRFKRDHGQIWQHDIVPYLNTGNRIAPNKTDYC